MEFDGREELFLDDIEVRFAFLLHFACFSANFAGIFGWVENWKPVAVVQKRFDLDIFVSFLFSTPVELVLISTADCIMSRRLRYDWGTTVDRLR
jgi:hypothetical protein